MVMRSFRGFFSSFSSNTYVLDFSKFLYSNTVIVFSIIFCVEFYLSRKEMNWNCPLRLELLVQISLRLELLVQIWSLATAVSKSLPISFFVYNPSISKSLEI